MEAECIIPVQINIHPGSSVNAVNLKSKTGQVPVAILSSAEGEYGLPIAIDATKIDPLSVHFGPSDSLLNSQSIGGATEFHNTGHVLDIVEMNEQTKDGDQDLLLHFNAKQTGLFFDDTEACVLGEINIEGTWYTFYGCDRVRVMQ